MKIIFEFVGGSRDGQTSVGVNDDQSVSNNEAECNYFITNEGKIGSRFFAATPYAIENMGKEDVRGMTEVYEVIDRLEIEDGSEVYVRCKFLNRGTEGNTPRPE